MKIKFKVMLSIILAVVLSIAGVTVMVSREMDKAFMENFSVSSKAQLQRMNAFVDNFFGSTISSAELLRDSPLVRGTIDTLSIYVDKGEIKPIGVELPDPERALYEELLRVHEHFPSYSLVYISNNKGGITQAPDDTLSDGFNPAVRPWYLDAVKAGKSILTEAYISDSGEAVCTVATPIPAEKGSGWSGVVALDISLNTLTEETGGVRVGETGYVIMLDATGQVVSDPRNSGDNISQERRWLGKTVDQLPSDASSALAALLRRDRNAPGIPEVEFDGRHWLAGVQTTGGGWSLIMLQERDEVFANAMRVTLSIFFVGVVIIALMIGVAFLVSRSIAGPVAALADASQRVAEGDLRAIPEDESLFKGEVGVLHRSLKRMVAKLGELIATANSKMQEAEEALALSKDALAQAEEAKQQAERARREGVHQAADQIGSAMGQLAGAAQNLSHEAERTEQRAEEQRDRVNATGIAIEQMNAAVNDVAASTSRTSTLADQASAEAQNGKALVMDVVASIQQIQAQSLAISKSLAELGGQAESIGAIMTVISDIADQTNLLALNAAIEAARAGDAGRGFAVVADEVRKLAEKTMEATRQVGTAISTIQAGTQSNMNAMQEAAAFVSQSTELAHKAGTALASIEEMVDTTASEVRAIATASEEQSATIAEINRSTEAIRTLTDDVAEGALHASQAVGELNRLSSSLQDIVSNLRQG